MYDGLAHRRGPIAEALDAGAVRMKQAKTKKEKDRARSETLDAVRRTVAAQVAALRRGAADRG